MSERRDQKGTPEGEAHLNEKPSEKNPSAALIEALPRNALSFLERLDPDERRHVVVLLCRVALTRDLTQVARFLGTVWENSKRAEDWVGRRRLTGRERDEYHEMIVQGIRLLVETGVKLAKRSGLTTILQRYRRTLRRYLPDEGTRKQGGGETKTGSPSTLDEEAA